MNPGKAKTESAPLPILPPEFLAQDALFFGGRGMPPILASRLSPKRNQTLGQIVGKVRGLVPLPDSVRCGLPGSLLGLAFGRLEMKREGKQT